MYFFSLAKQMLGLNSKQTLDTVVLPSMLQESLCACSSLTVEVASDFNNVQMSVTFKCNLSLALKSVGQN